MLKRFLPENFEVNSVNTDKRAWARAMGNTKVERALALPSRQLQSFRRITSPQNKTRENCDAPWQTHRECSFFSKEHLHLTGNTKKASQRRRQLRGSLKAEKDFNR